MKAIWQAYDKDGSLSEHHAARLAAINLRDGIFPDIDPGLWVAGAKEPARRADTAVPAPESQIHLEADAVPSIS